MESQEIIGSAIITCPTYLGNDPSTPRYTGFPCGSAGKESARNAGDLGSIPGLGRSPRERNSYPLQYSDLENSMDFTVHGGTKSWTRLSNFHFTMILLTQVYSFIHQSFSWHLLCACQVPSTALGIQSFSPQAHQSIIYRHINKALKSWHSKCSLWASNIGIPWELARNSASWSNFD